MTLALTHRKRRSKLFTVPTGYNIGMNMGRAAGRVLPDTWYTCMFCRAGWATRILMTTVGETRVQPEELTTTYLAITRRLGAVSGDPVFVFWASFPARCIARVYVIGRMGACTV